MQILKKTKFRAAPNSVICQFEYIGRVDGTVKYNLIIYKFKKNGNPFQLYRMLYVLPNKRVFNAQKTYPIDNIYSGTLIGLCIHIISAYKENDRMYDTSDMYV